MLLGAAGCWVLAAGQDGRHFWRVRSQIGRQDLARRDRRICRRVRLHLHLHLRLYLTCIYCSLLYKQLGSLHSRSGTYILPACLPV